MSKQFPKKSKTIYTNAGFGVDEVSKETLETNMNILKGIAQEQENKIKLLKEELSQLKASNQFDNLVKDTRGNTIKQLEEKLEKVTKIAEEVCTIYGDAFNDDPYSDYNNEFALQKQKELKEILKQQKAG